LKIGTSSSTTTRFPSRSVLVKVIVMGVFGSAALAAGLAAAAASGVAVRHGPAVGLAVVFHSRIDVAGGVGLTGSPAASVFTVGAAAGLAAGVGLAVVFHSRIDAAGDVALTGSPTSVGAVGVLAAGAGLAVVFHSRTDVAGGVVLTGSPATSVCNAVALSTGITRRASILVLGMALPSIGFP
jgi:hypothetical protein